MKKLNRESQKGFTIIEVMIVLAIAGLIMLIVFMAVPALQRNSRNTQRKNDVSTILGAVSEYQSNHNGSLPAGTGGPFSTAFAGAAPNLGYYKTPANVTWTVQATAATPTAVTDPDTVKLYTNAKCDATSAPTSAGASARSVIALYGIESSGPNVGTCQEM